MGYDVSADAYFDSSSGPLLRKDPNHCPGGYVLHFYCKYLSEEHRFDEFPHEYPGETRGECIGYARRYGWIFHKDNTGTCPKCAKALNARRTARRTAGGEHE